MMVRKSLANIEDSGTVDNPKIVLLRLLKLFLMNIINITRLECNMALS